MKSFIAMVLSFLIALSSFLGGSSKTGDENPGGVLNSGDCVAVIVELEEESLLDSVSGTEERCQLLSSYLKSGEYQKIEQAQEKIKTLIKNKISDADFNNSFSYSFVFNGFSLIVPYNCISTIEQLPGVKSVSIAARYNQPEEEFAAESLDGKFDYNLFTGVPEAHEKGYTGKGVVIAVLDTGFECSHEVFSGSVASPTLSKKDINTITTFKLLNTIVPRWGVNYYSEKIPYIWDYAEIDKTVSNKYSDHGTHVAGIAAGRSSEMTGVAPDAQLLLMKVFGDKKGSYAKDESILAALDDAVKLGADVINMSLGSPCGQNHDNPFSSAVFKKLQRSGITVSCSGGNEASMGENDAVSGYEKMDADLFDYGTVGSPASYKWPMAIASAAVSQYESSSDEALSIEDVGSMKISSFSSWGVTADLRLKPEITAPGSSIYSSVPGNSYDYMSGTSMAAPYYSGIYALVRQYVSEKFPSVEKKNSAEFINSILMSTAEPFSAWDKLTYYSPRQQGAGFANVEKAFETPAYLTQNDGVSRPKIELGEDTDGVLEFSFKVHNLSSSELVYKLRTVALTDSFSKKSDGEYINTLTASEIQSEDCSVEYGADAQNETVTVAAGASRTVFVRLTVSPELISKMREAFKNGFFVDGFVFLESEDEQVPALSIPFVSFNGDWSNPMLFDYSMYDSEPSYLGKQWGLMVSDGDDYYPLGANMFEKGKEYGIDTKYCAYSVNALQSKLENPYITVSVGLIRNGKRMDYNLFTQSGVFRYCGSSLVEYARKTNDPSRPETGLLWGGERGLVDGQSYVYKVSTTPANYKSKRVTVSFPFVVDNKKPTVESIDYRVEDGEAILTVRIKDNRYVMGFEMFGANDRSLGSVSFKGIEPENGVYTYTVNVSEKSRKDLSKLSDIKLYVVDYAYNEVYASASLTGGINVAGTVIDPAALTEIEPYRFISSPLVDLSTNDEGQKEGNASLLDRLIEKLKAYA